MAETIGNLIDKLTIANLRLWKLEDIKRASTEDSIIADATRSSNMVNQLRNDLIQEIDELFNFLVKNSVQQKLYKQGSTKLYGK